MSMQETIEQKLINAFSPSQLNVRDDSHLHAGHAGARPEGETHFHVAITAEQLQGMNRVAAQRAVYSVLADELAGTLHALELKIERSI